MSTFQPRKPAGSPQGGQFDTKPHDQMPLDMHDRSRYSWRAGEYPFTYGSLMTTNSDGAVIEIAPTIQDGAVVADIIVHQGKHTFTTGNTEDWPDVERYIPRDEWPEEVTGKPGGLEDPSVRAFLDEQWAQAAIDDAFDYHYSEYGACSVGDGRTRTVNSGSRVLLEFQDGRKVPAVGVDVSDRFQARRDVESVVDAYRDVASRMHGMGRGFMTADTEVGSVSVSWDRGGADLTMRSDVTGECVHVRGNGDPEGWMRGISNALIKVSKDWQ